MVDAVGIDLDAYSKQKECIPVQTAHIWAPRVTLTLCEDSGQEDGNVLETRGPLHSAFHRSNRRSRPTTLKINTGPRLFGQRPVDYINCCKFCCKFHLFLREIQKKSTFLPVSCFLLPTHSPNAS